jgi:hypothetical protein
MYLALNNSYLNDELLKSPQLFEEISALVSIPKRYKIDTRRHQS